MNLAKRSIEDVDVCGKRVLMRVDFDVPISATGDIIDDHRIVATIPTIRYILNRGAKSLVMMSHAGASFGSSQRLSLASVARFLEDSLKKPVVFLADRIGDAVEAACANPDPGSIILLENLNFYAEEEGKDITHDGFSIAAKMEDVELFRARLDALGDIFVNEAWRFVHEERSSVVGVDLPEMVAGLLLKSELDACLRILEQPTRPSLAIIGGASLSSRHKIVENMIYHCDVIIICGKMAFSFPKLCHNMRHGSDACQTNDDKLAQGLVEKASSKKCELVFPIDWVCAHQFAVGQIKDSLETAIFTSDQSIPEDWIGMDIGPQSSELFVSHIFKAKTVLWDGSPGNMHIDYFTNGTRVLFDAAISVCASDGFIHISSSDLVSAAAKWKLQEAVSFITSGCDTCTHLFEGSKLLGVSLLADKPRNLSWQGTATGKYAWDETKRGRSADEDTNCAEKISKYSWSDGKKRVSIYIEMEGVDDLAEEAFKLQSGSHDISLAFEIAGAKRTFELAGLSQEITGARVVQKKGKNLIALHLQKKEEKGWCELLATTEAAGSDDDT